MLQPKTLAVLGIGVGFIPAASTIILGIHYHTLVSGWALAGSTIGFASLLLVSGLVYNKFGSDFKHAQPSILNSTKFEAHSRILDGYRGVKVGMAIALAGFSACLLSGGIFGLLNQAAYTQTLSGMLLLSTGVAETALSAGQVAGLDIGFMMLAAVITVTCLFYTRRRINHEPPHHAIFVENNENARQPTATATTTTMASTQREQEQNNNVNTGGQISYGTRTYLEINPGMLEWIWGVCL